MKLEQQVCSLELSKRLKELGMKQESLCTWVQSTQGEQNYKIISFKEFYGAHHNYFCAGFDDEVHPMFAAFTVAELGEILSTKENHNTIRTTMAFTDWVCDYEAHRASGSTEANARAKMLIYLLENKLITL